MNGLENWVKLISYSVLAIEKNYKNLESEGAKKNVNSEKITFKVVQMNFLAMHITNQVLHFYRFAVGNVQYIFMEHDVYLTFI